MHATRNDMTNFKSLQVSLTTTTKPIYLYMSRALAPVEQAMGSWKTVLAARAAFARLQDLLDSMPQNPNAMPIPNPKGDVSVENIGYRYPEGEKPALARIDFELADGETLGIMGPTASGKSALALRLAARDGGVILNADVTLIAERPKIGPYREAMRTRLAQLLRLDPKRVNIKATTTEKLGFTGRGEGLAAQAIVTARLS